MRRVKHKQSSTVHAIHEGEQKKAMCGDSPAGHYWVWLGAGGSLVTCPKCLIEMTPGHAAELKLSLDAISDRYWKLRAKVVGYRGRLAEAAEGPHADTVEWICAKAERQAFDDAFREEGP